MRRLWIDANITQEIFERYFSNLATTLDTSKSPQWETPHAVPRTAADYQHQHATPTENLSKLQRVSSSSNNSSLDSSTAQKLVRVRHALERTGLRSVCTTAKLNIIDNRIANIVAVYNTKIISKVPVKMEYANSPLLQTGYFTPSNTVLSTRTCAPIRMLTPVSPVS